MRTMTCLIGAEHDIAVHLCNFIKDSRGSSRVLPYHAQNCCNSTEDIPRCCNSTKAFRLLWLHKGHSPLLRPHKGHSHCCQLHEGHPLCESTKDFPFVVHVIVQDSSKLR